MEGIFVKKEKVDFLTEDSKSDLYLLMEQDDVEIMLQTVHKDSIIWITPTDNEKMIEFFYIVKGSLSLEYEDEVITLNENDCFYSRNLKGKVLLKSHTDLKILYVANAPVFKYLENFYEELNYLLDKITEKDEYTKQHCKRVADFCLFISKKLKCADTLLDNLVVASLFHDVGKCFISDEILQKKGKLTKEEFKEIYKHPTHTKKLLSGKFSEEVISIAYEHHERLDGSGYPCGLMGDELSLASRIIAVADSFDAMTTKRPYNTPKDFSDAVDELFFMSDKYDRTVTTALKDLVYSGELFKMIEEVNS